MLDGNVCVIQMRSVWQHSPSENVGIESDVVGLCVVFVTDVVVVLLVVNVVVGLWVVIVTGVVLLIILAVVVLLVVVNGTVSGPGTEINETTINLYQEQYYKYINSNS